FLALTMHCAQCHNHKFDPVTARDYYRLQAFFITGQPANLALRDPALTARYQARLPVGYEAARQRRQELYDQTHRDLVQRTLGELPQEQRRAWALPPGRRSEEEERLARLAELKLQFTPARIEREVPADRRQEYDDLKKKLSGWEGTAPEVPQTFGFYAPGTAAASARVLPMKGFYPLPFDAQQLPPLRSRLLVGGDVHRLGPVLEPGWPAVFGPTPRELLPTPRQALADWLTSPANPLVARVWVNRLWQWHFGRGIVETSSDFGIRGARSTHPELLDWLADEFVASGGSTKHLHRLI